MKKVVKHLLTLICIMLLVAGCSQEAAKPEQSAETPQESAVVEETLSIDVIKEALTDEGSIVVDTRLTDAYNGWALDGLEKGGHIEGAVDFSFNWLAVEKEGKDEELKGILEAKGIIADKKVYLYDANGSDALLVEAYLKDLGFEDITIFNINKWIDESGQDLVQFENYQLIVPAVVVKDILDGKTPESFKNAKNIKVVEASWGDEDTSYGNGHIPTAFHINTDSVEPPPAWMLADDKTLEQFAIDHGFTADDTVIVTSEEPMASYRVALVLKYIGVADARVLNGGTAAWTMAGYELETESIKPTPVESFGAPVPGRPDIVDTIEETKEGLAHPEAYTLVDNRTWEEHIGESSGYTYHDKMGRIPGSVYGYAGVDNSYSMTYFRNIDNTMRNADEFIALWEEQGIDLNKRLAFMCGSGWRAAEIYYFADVYGVKDITLYSDGWIGWSNDLSNPVETGDPSK